MNKPSNTPPEPAEEPWAAQRAADWYDRPDTRTDKAVHVGRADGWSRCGRSFLSEDLAWDPAEVSEDLRCRSNGCRQAWPTIAPAAPGGAR
jgi:hypothetical protein